jgi:hypothetical protein
MTTESVGYEIRDASTPDGDLVLDLVVEGAVLARATASATILEDMRSRLGLDRAAVVAELKEALVDALKTRGQSVVITDLREESGRPLRFSARFTYRLRNDITTGVVWYDVNTSQTGPDDLATVVRNKMRNEVHRHLTSDGSAARALVDLHE